MRIVAINIYQIREMDKLNSKMHKSGIKPYRWTRENRIWLLILLDAKRDHEREKRGNEMRWGENYRIDQSGTSPIMNTSKGTRSV